MNSPQLNTEEINKAVIRRLYEECLNGGKMEIADALISPQFISPGPDAGTGPAGFKITARRLRGAFPDIHFVIHDLIAENDRVALFWTWEGTHQGPFAGIPPTGKQVRQEGMVMYRLEGGRIVAARVLVDRLGVFQQMGVVPGLPGLPQNAEAAKT